MRIHPPQGSARLSTIVDNRWERLSHGGPEGIEGPAFHIIHSFIHVFWHRLQPPVLP